MAIRMMTSEDEKNLPNVETVIDYPGHKNPLYMKTTYVGCVISVWEKNGYDDSDFYAEVWDEETQSIKTIEYASTRGWCYPNGARIDATPEVIDKVRAYLKKKNLEALQMKEKQEAHTVYKDKLIKVVKGKKVPVGTIGKVFWIGTKQYGYSKWTQVTKIGIKVLDSEGNPIFDSDKDPELAKKYGNDLVYFTDINNVQVFNPEQYMTTTQEEFERQALYLANQTCNNIARFINYSL